MKECRRGREIVPVSYQEKQKLRPQISIPEGTKALLFDLDGTLVDSMWVWSDIDRDYLSSHGIHTKENIQQLIGGISMRQTAVLFQEHFHIKDSIEQMMADWNQMAMDRYRNEVRPKPGAKELLALAGKRGWKTAIATSNSRELCEAALSGCGLAGAFDAVVTGNEITNGKPAPDIYLHTAERLGVPPKQCLVFEDLVDGILAGKAAGCRVIAVLDETTREDNDKKRRLADGAVRDFTELELA